MIYCSSIQLVGGLRLINGGHNSLCHPVEGGAQKPTQVQLPAALVAQRTPGSTPHLKREGVGLAGESCGGRESQAKAQGAWLLEIAVIPQKGNRHSKQPNGLERPTASSSLPCPWAHLYCTNVSLLLRRGLIVSRCTHIPILAEF